MSALDIAATGMLAQQLNVEVFEEAFARDGPEREFGEVSRQEVIEGFTAKCIFEVLQEKLALAVVNTALEIVRESLKEL